MSQIENSYFGEHSLGVRTPYSASINRRILAGLVTAFDPPPPDEQGYTPSDKRPNQSAISNREPTASYREIGGTLLETEARYLAVGIPWFPQNCLSDRCQATANLPWKRDETPLNADEFVRMMLVNIPTGELESYLEDLAALPLTKEAAAILGLGGISSTQRYILPLVVFLGCAGLIFAAAFWSQIALRPALGFAFTGGGVSALFALAFCNEGTRRRSFHWCLNQEVLRRKGIIPSSGNPIIPLRIGPVGSMD